MCGNKTIQIFRQYFNERFSIGKFLFLSFIFGISISFFSQYFVFGYLKFYISILYVTVALFLFLLRLRLWDEIKDHKHDKLYYPNRPIARGLIPVKYLWFLSYLVLLVELAISVSGGIISFVFFLILLGYSFLMLKEFLAGEWLRSKFTMYIITHELSVVPLFFYLISLNFLPFRDIFKGNFFYLFVFCLGCETFLIEIARKIRVRRDENISRDTYIAQYGKEKTTILIFLLGFFILIIRWALLYLSGRNFLVCGLISGTVFAIAIFNMLKFIEKEDKKYIKNINNFIIFFVILANLSFLILLI